MRDKITALADAQGFVTAAQIRQFAWSRHAVAALVGEGRLEHPVWGTYLPRLDRSPEEKHRLLVRAALSDHPFAAASHHSALALLGAPFHRLPVEQVHLAWPRSSSRIRTVHQHVLREGDRVIDLEGHRSLEPALVTLQVAARYGGSSGLVAADWLIRHEHCTTTDLRDLAASGRLRRGARAARYCARHADGRSESPGETLLRTILIAASLPFDLQVNVGGPGTGYVADFVVEGVVVEFDGLVKYRGSDGHDAVVREKIREDWIRGQGYGVVRIIWADLSDPVRIINDIRQAMIRHRAGRYAG